MRNPITWNAIHAHQDRIERQLRIALRAKPTCPKCGTDQLQIMNHYALGNEPPSDPQWRCRMCKHRRFETAPPLNER
jgi:rubrerythrin